VGVPVGRSTACFDVISHGLPRNSWSTSRLDRARQLLAASPNQTIANLCGPMWHRLTHEPLRVYSFVTRASTRAPGKRRFARLPFSAFRPRLIFQATRLDCRRFNGSLIPPCATNGCTAQKPAEENDESEPGPSSEVLKSQRRRGLQTQDP